MPEPPQSGTPRRRRPLTRVAIATARAGLVLAAAALVAGGWYAHHRGLTRKWRSLVTAEFARRGIHLSLGQLTLDPFEGLIARDVRIYGDARHRAPIATVNRVALSIDLGALLRRENFLDVVDLREATLSVPIRPREPDSFVLRLTDMHARAKIENGQVRVTHARARLHTLEIFASGTILTAPGAPAADAPPAPGSAGPGPARNPVGDRGASRGHDILSAVVDTLGSLVCRGANPRLDIEFNGELAHVERAQIHAALRGRDLGLRGYHVGSIEAEAILQDARVELRRCVIDDDEGRLVARGVCHGSTGELNLQVQSGIDIQRLVREFLPEPKPAGGVLNSGLLQEFVFYPMPRIDASIRAELKSGGHPRIHGSFETAKAIFRTLVLEKLRGDFSWDGTSLLLDPVTIEHRTGKLRGRLLSRPDRFSARVESSINPNILRPLVQGRTRAALSEWVFRDAPEIRFEVEGDRPDPATFEGSGQVELGRTLYRGVPFHSATSNLLWEKGTLTCEEFWLERDEGFAEGTFSYDFLNREVRLDKVITTVNPHETSVWANPSLGKDIRAFEFDKPPSLVLDGVVRAGPERPSDLRIDIRAPAGVRYLLFDRWIPLGDVEAKLHFAGDTLNIEGLHASLFGGRVSSDVAVNLAPGQRRYTAAIQLDEVRFADLTKLYFNFDDAKGSMHATYRLSADPADPRSTVGTGEAVVVEGNVFAIPVLGPLSKLLGEILPGIGYSHARRATATWETRAGRIQTRDFEVQGTGFTMLGEGWIDYVDDRMDFNVRINARGVPGILFFPVSKLFEYTSTGSFSVPNWRPKRLSFPRIPSRAAPKPPAPTASQ